VNRMICVLICHGKKIRYELEHKPVKNMNLRVRPDGRVHLSVGRRVTQKQAEQFVASKAEWILSAIEKYQADTVRILTVEYREGGTVFYLGKEYIFHIVSGKPSVFIQDHNIIIVTDDPSEEVVRRLFLRWYELQCSIVIREMVEQVFPLFSDEHIVFPTISLRYMKSRWGSCTIGKGKITLNKHLLKVPKECIELVVAHELTHLICPNHSRDFYRVLYRILPDAEERKNKLNRYLLV
jgi:predicted metal-dependent hydrolase